MVLTLAVGIGLNTGVFAILDGLMFRPHVVNEPRSFVQVLARYSGWYATEDLFQEFTALDYQAMRDRARFPSWPHGMATKQSSKATRSRRR